LLTLKAHRDNWFVSTSGTIFSGPEPPVLGANAPAGAGRPGTESTDSSRRNSPGATLPWLPSINGDDSILR
jgi:hypothetical protein